MSEKEEKTEIKSTSTSSSSKTTKKKTSTPKKPAARPSMPKRPKVYRFEQWAARRKVPSHHLGGLKAYAEDAHKPRTLEAWDKCFEDY